MLNFSEQYSSNTFDFLDEKKNFSSASNALKYITNIYDKSILQMQNTFSQIKKNKLFNPKFMQYYPYIGVTIHENHHMSTDHKLSYGLICEKGTYGMTVTNPHLFKEYYSEQLSLLIENNQTEIVVGISKTKIPFPYVIPQKLDDLTPNQLKIVKQTFSFPDLKNIHDDIANGKQVKTEIKPLSLFCAERVDYSLQRLLHYTGTSPEHFQNFILLTNYQQYVNEFIEYSKNLIQTDSSYTDIIGPGNIDLMNETLSNLPQMPAYHLKKKDKSGVSFINIGVGPSNAKNITDHLAVLRPHCWIMVGHCAGLRSSQVLGDYVLAHGYVREDHVMDYDLPSWVPVPPIAEVQLALQQALINVAKDENNIEKRLRTGTILTTDDRNWELKSKELYKRFRQSRAIAVDMESATIAANGFRFRVPYGTILCVSDKPIHGEIKLNTMAKSFYKKRVKEHLLVGLEAISLLKSDTNSLHSRKLRGFDDPSFR